MKMTNGSVLIPEEMLTEIMLNTLTEGWHEAESMKKFCQLVFPNLEENINTPGHVHPGSYKQGG